MMFHTSCISVVWSLSLSQHQEMYVMLGRLGDGAYLANELPLSAHEGDAVLHRQVQSSLYGLLQREVKVKPIER